MLDKLVGLVEEMAVEYSESVRWGTWALRIQKTKDGEAEVSK